MRPVEDPQVPDFVRSLQRFSTFSEVEEIKKSTDFAVAGAEERTIFLEDTVIMTEGHRHTELKQMFAPLLSREAIAYDLPPGRPSFITRVPGFDSRRFWVWQARRVRWLQIVRASGALLLGYPSDEWGLTLL